MRAKPSPRAAWTLVLFPREYRRHREQEIRATLELSGCRGAAETLALAGLAGRAWSRRVLCADPRVNSRAAGVAAVVAAVAISVLAAARVLSTAVRDPLQLIALPPADTTGWIGWAAAGIAVGCGLSRTARALAVAGTGYQLAVVGALYLHGEWGTAITAVAYAAAQAGVLGLLWSPRRVARGRAAIGRAGGIALTCAAVLLAAVSTIGAGLPLFWLTHREVEIYPLSDALRLAGIPIALVAVVPFLFTRTGRAALPALLAVAGLLAGGQLSVNHWLQTAAGRAFGSFPLESYVLIGLVPIAAFLVARILVGAVDVVAVRSGR